MEITYIIIAAIAGLLIGGLITFLITRKNNQTLVAAAEEKASAILKEAQSKGDLLLKDKTLEAKDRFLQMKTEHEKHISEKDKNIQQAENRIKQKETTLNQQIEQSKRKQTEIETLQNNLNAQLEIVDRRKEELDKAHHKQVQALEKIAGLSAEDAKSQLVEALKAEAKTGAMQFIKETMDEAKLTAAKKLRRLSFKPSNVSPLNMPLKMQLPFSILITMKLKVV